LMAGTGRSRGELPIACNLAGPEQVRRREAVRGLLDRSRLVGEMEDGYEFAFPGDADWAMRLTELIVAERSCCPFFTFELAFGPGGGEILLRVRGPEGTKQFIGEELSAASR
jgi:hypothetical protein